MPSGGHHFKMSIQRKKKKKKSKTHQLLFSLTSPQFPCTTPAATTLHYWWDFLCVPHLPQCRSYSPVGSRGGCGEGPADATQGKARHRSGTLTAYWQGAMHRARSVAGYWPNLNSIGLSYGKKVIISNPWGMAASVDPADSQIVNLSRRI